MGGLGARERGIKWTMHQDIEVLDKFPFLKLFVDYVCQTQFLAIFKVMLNILVPNRSHYHGYKRIKE